jgi:hypothetical protein
LVSLPFDIDQSLEEHPLLRHEHRRRPYARPCTDFAIQRRATFGVLAVMREPLPRRSCIRVGLQSRKKDYRLTKCQQRARIGSLSAVQS